MVPIDQATDILFIVDGFSAMSDGLLFAGTMSKKDKARKCAEMLKLYGPQGTVIRGAVVP